MSKFDSLINGLIIKIEKFCLEHADYTIVLTNKTKEIIQKIMKFQMKNYCNT